MRRRTTGAASIATCGCSRPARASARPARRARSRASGAARARRRTGRRRARRRLLRRERRRRGDRAARSARRSSSSRRRSPYRGGRPADAAAVSASGIGGSHASRSRPRSASSRPAIAEARGCPAGDELYAFELDLDAVARRVGLTSATTCARNRCRASHRSCATCRCWSIAPCLRLPFVALSARRRLRRSRSVIEFDRYRGKGVPEGRVSLSLRLTFRVPGADADGRRSRRGDGADRRGAGGAHGATTQTVEELHGKVGSSSSVASSGYRGDQIGSKQKLKQLVAVRSIALRTETDAAGERLELRPRRRGEYQRATDENARLRAELDAARGRIAEAEGTGTELRRCARSASRSAAASTRCSSRSKRSICSVGSTRSPDHGQRRRSPRERRDQRAAVSDPQPRSMPPTSPTWRPTSRRRCGSRPASPPPATR